MDLWNGHISEFIESASSGGFGILLEQQFARRHRSDPSDAEVKSWDKSLGSLATSVQRLADQDIGVLIEYHLPLSERRIDAMFFGDDGRGHNSVLVELKQWEQVALEDEFCDNVLVGGLEHVHPCQQALDYAGFLQDIHSDYSRGGVTVRPCGYCHNAADEAVPALRDGRFAKLLDSAPLFAAAELDRFGDFVDREVGAGQGMSLLRRVRAGRFQPSPKVIDTLSQVLQLDRAWHLLDVQRKAYNRIVAEVRRMQRSPSRSAVLVRGGPGTGKTVIAIQALAEMLREGLRGAHSTGGKAFTTTLQAKFDGAHRLFTWNMSLRNAPPMELDLLLVDEAHRIRKSSDTRFTRAADRNRRSQVDELLDAAKVTVFFLDEHQYVRPDEIGESKLIREATAKRSIPLVEYDLSAQFRCGGSVEYLEWVDWLLGFRTEPSEDWRGRYRLDFVTTPEELDDLMEEGTAAGETCRLVAGFSWEWSAPLTDGTLVDDVQIGQWSRPWNRKPRNIQYRPARHPYTLWATTDEGLGQVGCVYSAQGFEFDRVAVIWGPDLVWRDGKWVAQRNQTKDPGLRRAANDEELNRLMRNVYRVLLTRGMKRTTVLCLDVETREHLVRLSQQVLELT